MDNRPVLFIDSGIGGLPYFQYISSIHPDERFIYTADRKNFPYGPKSREVLIDVLETLIYRLIDIYGPKMIILACNTASVSALDTLRLCFPEIPFIGTVPAVKPAVLETKTGIIGVLGTSRTVEDPYIQILAKKYRSDVKIKGIAAPELVDFVEYHYESASIDERQKLVLKYIDEFRTAGADGIVLGCTHFLFLLDDFRKAAPPDVIIYDSIEGVGQRFSAVLREMHFEHQSKTLIVNKEKNILLITGSEEAESIWKQRGEMFNMKLEVLDHVQKKGNV